MLIYVAMNDDDVQDALTNGLRGHVTLDLTGGVPVSRKVVDGSVDPMNELDGPWSPYLTELNTSWTVLEVNTAVYDSQPQYVEDEDRYQILAPVPPSAIEETGRRWILNHNFVEVARINS